MKINRQQSIWYMMELIHILFGYQRKAIEVLYYYKGPPDGNNISYSVILSPLQRKPSSREKMDFFLESLVAYPVVLK